MGVPNPYTHTVCVRKSSQKKVKYSATEGASPAVDINRKIKGKIAAFKRTGKIPPIVIFNALCRRVLPMKKVAVAATSVTAEPIKISAIP